jgi:ATP-binding cassette, subfamily B, bacterial
MNMQNYASCKKAPAIMKYNLTILSDTGAKTSFFSFFKSLLRLIPYERTRLLLALLATLVNSFINLGSPFLIGFIIDNCIRNRQFQEIPFFAAFLGVMYLLALMASHYQTKLMGSIGLRLLFTLRNTLFQKVQSLPVAFFKANKEGDLIARFNNDTEKLNAFFSESLANFVGLSATTVGSAVFLLAINLKMGIAALTPAILILVLTRSLSPRIHQLHAKSNETSAGLGAEVLEMLNNFKIITTFNKRPYFKQRFSTVNQENYRNSMALGIASNLVAPIYGLILNTAQFVLLLVGIFLLKKNQLSIGILISYLLNVTNFYNPLKMLAPVWTQLKGAVTAMDRIQQILSLTSDLQHSAPASHVTEQVVELKNVSFGYEPGKEVLHNISLKLAPGKKYAFIGPTGGGKTTIALLIARLYDPTNGAIFLNGRDIRSVTPKERTKMIGFILQDPFIFSGTVKSNILYGNDNYCNHTDQQLETLLADMGFNNLLQLFPNGLNTAVTPNGANISIGQKQIISFIRVLLREPDILILDEASANLDAGTEQTLEVILNQLPKKITRITIAHRLNTIENADEIYFVSDGGMARIHSVTHAIHKFKERKQVT